MSLNKGIKLALKDNRFVSIVVTLSLLAGLFLSGPAEAVTLGITDLSEQQPIEEEEIWFLAKMDVHKNDILPVSNFTVTVSSDGKTYSCTFDKDGNNLTACDNFPSIDPKTVYTGNYQSTAGYGYGYGYNGTYEGTINESFGYGYGYSPGMGSDDYNESLYAGGSDTAEFVYNITFQTPSVSSDTEYDITFRADMSGSSNYAQFRTLSSNKKTVTVNADTAAPTVTVHSPESMNYSTDTVDLNVTANESVDTWQYSLDGGSNTTFTPNTTLPSLGEGGHTVTVYANDAAGNTGTSSVTFTVDTTPPHIQYEPESPSDGSTVSGTQTLNFTASDTTTSLDTVSISIDGSQVTTCSSSPCSYSWGTAGETDGSHNFTATANDTQDNTNTSLPTRTVTVDNTPPNVTVSSPADGTVYSSSGIDINATVEDTTSPVSEVLAEVNGTENVTLVQDGTTWYNDTYTFAEGSNNVRIYANDTQGNMNDTQTVSFTVDTEKPGIQTNITNGTYYDSQSLTFSLNFTDSNPDTVWAYNGSENVSHSGSNTTFSLNYNSDGEKSVVLYANDTAGNLNYTSYTFTVDTQGPSWSQNTTSPTSPTTYEPGKPYQFNITWNDTTSSVDEVIFEFDGRNYTYPEDISKDGEEYHITLTDLAANPPGYIYRWYANDTEDNWNSTDPWNYTVKRASPSLELKTNCTWSGTTYEAVCNQTGHVLEGDSSATKVLYRDGQQRDTGTPASDIVRLGAGIHSYNYTYKKSENYTFKNVTHVLNITKKDADVVISPPTGTITYGKEVDQYCRDDSSLLNCNIYRNDTRAVTNDTQTTLGGGTYEYTANITDDSNYTDWEETNLLTVKKAPTSTELLLNRTKGNYTYNYSQTANFTVVLNISGKTVKLDTNMTGWTVKTGTGTLVSLESMDEVGVFNITGYFAGDENYTSSSKTHYATVKDFGAPSVTLNSPGNETYERSQIDINATASDSESSVGMVLAEVNGTENVTLVQDGTTWYNDTYNFADGSNRVRIYAKDEEGNWNDEKTVTFTVDTSYPSSSITPNSAVWEAEDQSFNISCSDATSDCNTTYWENVSAGSECPTQGSFANSGTPKVSDTVTCDNGSACRVDICYYSVDNEGNAEPTRRSGTFNIDKVEPSISYDAVTPDNGSRQTDNSVTISASVSDSDSGVGQCTLKWGEETEAVAVSDGTCSVQKSTSDGANYTFRMYANDTVGNRNSEVERTFRENEEPSISSVSMTPGSPETQDDLNCTAYGWNDSEGDEENYYYDWYRDGDLIKTIHTSSRSTVLDSENTSEGETWTCIVTPYDGYEEGSSILASEEIQNTAPTVSSVSANTTYVTSGDIINVTTSGASDVNGEETRLECGNASGKSNLCVGEYGDYERSCTFSSPWSDDSNHKIYCRVYDGTAYSGEVNTSVTADNTPPSCSVSGIGEGKSSEYQHISETTIYYNNETSGNFTTYVSSSDGGSGVGHISFPDTVSSGDNDWSSPYSWTYIWDTNDIHNSSNTVTCFDDVNNSETDSFKVYIDFRAPSGGSVSYTDGYITTTSETISYSTGSDNMSGLNTSTGHLEKRSADLSGGECGSYSSWSDLAYEIDGSYNDSSLSNGMCYQYRYVIDDKVMNTGIYEPGYTLKVEAAPPSFFNNRTDPQSPYTYSPGQNYQFNMTWSDEETSVEEVILEFNGTNYSYQGGRASNSGEEYYITLTDLSAGLYSYRWYGKDAQDNWNIGDQQTYEIEKAPVSIDMWLNGTLNSYKKITYPEDVNATCKINISQQNGMKLYVEGTDKGEQTGQIKEYVERLGAGTYNFTCKYPDSVSENYSSNSRTQFLQIREGTVSGNLSGSGGTYPDEASIEFTESNPGDGDIDYKLYRNGSFVQNLENGDSISPELGAGTYKYMVNSTDGENYSSSTSLDTVTLTIEVGEPTLSLTNNATSPVTYPTTVNVTAFSCPAQLDCDFLRNDTGAVSTPNIVRLGAGSYRWWYTTDGNPNYTEETIKTNLTVKKGSLSGTLSGSDTSYPDNVSVSLSEENEGDNDVEYRVYINGSYHQNISDGESVLQRLSAGTYRFTVNSTGGENYSSKALLDTTILDVSKGHQRLILELNGSRTNRTYEKGSIANITAISNATVDNMTADIAIISNFTGAQGPISKSFKGLNVIQNLTDTSNLDTGRYVISANIYETQNYTAAYSNELILRVEDSIPPEVNLSLGQTSIETESDIKIFCNALDEGSGLKYTNLTVFKPDGGNVSVTCGASFSDTRSEGFYFVSYNATDMAGNLNHLNASFTASTPSGGGEEGGGWLSPPAAPAPPSSSESWEEITSGETGIMKISNGSIGFSAISFSVDETVIDAEIIVTQQESKPEDVEEPEGDVYRYVKVNTTNLGEGLEEANIEFNVSKEWIQDNNIDKDKIYLHRYEDGEWEKYETTVVSGTYDKFTYEASISGFSYFAVTGEEITEEPVVTKEECPYECCVEIKGYKSKSCEEGYRCVNSSCVKEETEECPDCPEPTQWSKCVNGTKTRTNYRCSEETNYTCVEYREFEVCEKEKGLPVLPIVAVIAGILLIGAGFWIKREKGMGKSKSRTWESIEAIETNEMKIEDREISFSNIVFTLNEKATDVKVKVKKLESAPSDAPDIDMISYQYLGVDTNISDGNVKEAAIYFAVERRWLEENNIDPEDINLYRYAGSKWNRLDTDKVSEYGNYTTYEATTPGLSYFVIAGKGKPTGEKNQVAEILKEEGISGIKEKGEELKVKEERPKPEGIGEEGPAKWEEVPKEKEKPEMAMGKKPEKTAPEKPKGKKEKVSSYIMERLKEIDTLGGKKEEEGGPEEVPEKPPAVKPEGKEGGKVSEKKEASGGKQVPEELGVEEEKIEGEGLSEEEVEKIDEKVEETFKCEKCGREFDTKKGRSIHYAHMHAKEEEEAEEMKEREPEEGEEEPKPEEKEGGAEEIKGEEPEAEEKPEKSEEKETAPKEKKGGGKKYLSDEDRVIKFLSEHNEKAFAAPKIAEEVRLKPKEKENLTAVSEVLSSLENKNIVLHKKPYWTYNPGDDNPIE